MCFNTRDAVEVWSVTYMSMYMCFLQSTSQHHLSCNDCLQTNATRTSNIRL